MVRDGDTIGWGRGGGGPERTAHSHSIYIYMYILYEHANIAWGLPHLNKVIKQYKEIEFLMGI